MIYTNAEFIDLRSSNTMGSSSCLGICLQRYTEAPTWLTRRGEVSDICLPRGPQTLLLPQCTTSPGKLLLYQSVLVLCIVYNPRAQEAEAGGLIVKPALPRGEHPGGWGPSKGF